MTEPAAPNSSGSKPDDTDLPEGRRASLWADAARELRHDAVFLVSAGIVTVFVLMAAFPTLFTDADPRACTLSRSLQPSSADHWFGGPHV